MPFISTIIPVYNRANLIRATLDSVLQQDETDHEVIVVDDGSTDATPEVLAEYGKRIQVLRQRNQGPGAVRNLGIFHATGEYIVFLDSDDLWFPWTLSTFRKVIKECDSPSFVACSVRRFEEQTDNLHDDDRPVRYEQFDDYFSASCRHIHFGASQVVVRRQALQQVGGFVQTRMNAEDHDFTIRLGTLPGFVYVDAPAMVAYRSHAGSAVSNLTNTLDGIRHLISTEQRQLYPGGTRREFERRRIITRHVRPVTLSLLLAGRNREAWDLYRACFLWHLRQGSWRYLLGMPGKALLAGIPNKSAGARSSNLD